MVERGGWLRRVEDHLDLFGAGLVLVLTQVVYLQTMTISCPFWDSGEFIATSYILGIPHPPGTPLYVLIGRFFTLLPIFPQVATRVNWLSALGSSLAAVFTYLMTVELWRRGRREGSGEEARGERWTGLVAGLVAAFFVAFSRTFWDNAIEAEVYALSSLLMAMSVWLILRWARTGGSRAEKNGLFVLLYYLLCLSMGIHLGTFLVLPGILLFVLLEDHRSLAAGMAGAVLVAGLILLLHPGMLPTMGVRVWLPLALGVLLAGLVLGRKWPVVSGHGVLLWCLLVAVLGISTHLYLTIRSYYGNPAINEADPQTWDALWKVLTRDQYKPPNPFLVRKAGWGVQLGRHFWDYARDQYALGLRPAWLGWYLPYALGLLGAVGHYFRERKGFGLMLVSYLAMSLGLVFYLNFQADEVRERDYFFVASFQFFAVWIGLGAAVLLRGLRGSVGRGWGLAGAGVVLVLLPWMTCRQYWYEHDRTRFYVARDFAYNMLTPLKPNAVLFTNGDNDTFPLWYLQEVEKIRRDVRVANLSLLNTDWYMLQLRDQSPRVDLGWNNQEIANAALVSPYMAGYRAGYLSKQMAERFLSETNLRRYVPDVDQPVLTKDVAAARIVEREYGKRPLYLALTVPDAMGFENRLVQEGLVFEIREPSPQEDRVDLEKSLRNLNEVYRFQGVLKPDGSSDETVYKDGNATRLIQNYAVAYLATAQEMRRLRRSEEAIQLVQRALALAPRSLSVCYAAALLEIDMERWNEAERLLQSLAAQGVVDARVHRLMGRVQEATGRLDDAERSYRQGLEMAPGSFETVRSLFLLLWDVKKERAAAVAVLDAWLARHPEDRELRRARDMYADSLARLLGRGRS